AAVPGGAPARDRGRTGVGWSRRFPSGGDRRRGEGRSMRQLIQSYRTGEMKVEEVPPPAARPGGVVVRTVRSLVSAGTEKMIVDLARKSLLAKARARPDLVRKVLNTARKQGIANTLRKVQSKLDTPIPLGYSSAGVVVEVGEAVHEYRVGDRVACAGAGYANHADYNYVPR